jgi:hypothetical protein
MKILLVKVIYLRQSECQTTSCIFQVGFQKKIMIHLLMEVSFLMTDDPELEVLISSNNSIQTRWAKRGL